ncbi:GGDEF domain-containing protein [Qipengyuania zhejiangensis]|uniref:GGDEF domain-containing protein n=1 Tax=Qipengyuania zhejiangensis TaxID=3077782 RepID=UPI002D7910C5|nr:diguanylate cyclase [Qipengyuania sp. Z2]
MIQGFLLPKVPAHVRDDFARLTARHMRGQATLMFTGFIASLPFVILSAPAGAGKFVTYGLPAAVLALCVFGLIFLREHIDQDTPLNEVQRLVAHGWKVSTFIAALGSLWCLTAWFSAPPEQKIYFPATLALGALTMGYCLSAIRAAAIGTLAVTILPISLTLLLAGNRMDMLLAPMLLIAMSFQLVMLGRQQKLLIELVVERQRSRELARTDPLTGIPNRRALMEDFANFAKAGETVRLMVVDIDRFKSINDRFGHDVGDTILQAFSTILARHARGSIVLARLGGEEFAILGSCTVLDPAIALQVLGEIRNAMMPHDEQVTASIGVAQAHVTSEADWNGLYSRADRALYAAKRDGRNRVASGDDLGPAGTTAVREDRRVG